MAFGLLGHLSPEVLSFFSLLTIARAKTAHVHLASRRNGKILGKEKENLKKESNSGGPRVLFLSKFSYSHITDSPILIGHTDLYPVDLAY